MRLGDRVVLDACVLAPMPLVDTLLSMAEFPGMYEPRWTQEILAEMRRTLLLKFGLSEGQVLRRETAQAEFFPYACVSGYEPLIEAMRNHPKDRHVAAAAMHCGARLIVTSNTKDFPKEAVGPLGMECIGPSAFLRRLHDLAPEIFSRRLEIQADRLGWPLAELLRRLRVNAPNFVNYLCEVRH